MINSQYFKKSPLNFTATLRQTSYDDTQKVYMVNYTDLVIDFDTVKEKYCEQYGSDKKASKSADALVVNKSGKIIFIEFKNGKLNGRHKSSSLKSKLKDSLLIFCDINNLQLDFARENIEYILVYNENENSGSIDEQRKKIVADREGSMLPQYGLSYIQNQMARLGNQRFVYFGLEVLKNVFVSDVHTYNVSEFDHYYQNYLK